MDKVDEKLLDAQITENLQHANFDGLRDLLDLPEDIMSQIVISKLENPEIEGEIPPNILQEILIARDKKVLGLKKYDISRVKSGELVLDEELRQYNSEIEDEEEITVVRGKSQDGKDNVLYYYSSNDMATRQQRTFNEHGDIESMHRYAMFQDGRLSYIDNAVVSYKYDEKGNKKVALYQDGLIGMTYYEYDKNGDVSIYIQDEAIGQKIKEDGYTYTIHDGYFIPHDNGYTYIGMPDTEKLTPDDMKRTVWGNIPQDKKQAVLSGMDSKRKEEVLSILTAVEPIFKSLSTDVQKNEKDVKKRMDKVVTWFAGFSKRLRIDPKLAVQDNAVMSTMKSAVHKTIGKTADAQMDLSTPTKDEKVYEGEDYGNN